MPASAWDPYNWFSWYTWWIPEDKEEIDEDVTKETPIEEENIDTIEEEIFPKEEEIEAKTEEITKEETEAKTEDIPKEESMEEEKPKRKRRTVTKKTKTKNQDAIELVLRPSILEELEKEAIITDSTINQVIQVILEAHIESKATSNLQTEVWKCNFCDPEREFRDYFEFSEHFFNEHMRPGLQKISDFKKEQ